MPSTAVEAGIACVDVFVSLAEAHRDWTELEAIDCASPYQSFAEAWFSTVGAATGAQPFIVVARETLGRPAALLPLARRRVGPLAVAAFPGGKDSNFNLGLFRPGRRWSAGALRSLLRAAARATPARVDCFALLNQPRSWQGVRNPISALGGRPSPSFAYKSELPLTFAAWRDAHASKEEQKKLRKLAQKLESMGPVAHVAARNEARRRAFSTPSSKRSASERDREGRPIHMKARPRGTSSAAWRSKASPKDARHWSCTRSCWGTASWRPSAPCPAAGASAASFSATIGIPKSPAAVRAVCCCAKPCGLRSSADLRPSISASARRATRAGFANRPKPCSTRSSPRARSGAQRRPSARRS